MSISGAPMTDVTAILDVVETAELDDAVDLGEHIFASERSGGR